MSAANSACWNVPLSTSSCGIAISRHGFSDIFFFSDRRANLQVRLELIENQLATRLDELRIVRQFPKLRIRWYQMALKELGILGNLLRQPVLRQLARLARESILFCGQQRKICDLIASVLVVLSAPAACLLIE